MSQENKKWIYSYGDGKAEGNATMRNLLGGKGCGLHDMSSIGLPVPPGFTITTEFAPTIMIITKLIQLLLMLMLKML